MKNIKSLIVTICCFYAAMDVQAQTETRKMADKPSPQVALPPVQTPEMPNAPKPTANTEPVAETPSPKNRDKNQQPQPALEKSNLKVVEITEPETPGGEEGKKIMAGKATRPAPEINNQSTIDTRPAPQVKIPKPVNNKQQQ
jgi:hypothetical protein